MPSSAAVPPQSRAYWICQVTGWCGFATYVAGAYFVFAPAPELGVAAIILVFDSVACLAATHLLRQSMYRRRWLELPLRRFVPRAIVSVALIAAVLTALVAVLDVVPDGSFDIGLAGLAWTLLAFVWAVAVWLLIYWSVQARRRRERSELTLTVLAREAQLDALRAQVNPHFLFNCLNSLRGLIAQDADRAMSMVTMLSDLLRYGLASDRRRVVPLAEELTIVDKYLDLERIRFEERLRVERAIDERALEASVPPMLVLTLVENAVKHGIARLPNGGVLRISAAVNGTGLQVIVANAGALEAAGQPGFGLHSATERLLLLYGDRASIALTSEQGTTVASVSMPVEP